MGWNEARHFRHLQGWGTRAPGVCRRPGMLGALSSICSAGGARPPTVLAWELPSLDQAGILPLCRRPSGSRPGRQLLGSSTRSTA